MSQEPQLVMAVMCGYAAPFNATPAPGTTQAWRLYTMDCSVTPRCSKAKTARGTSQVPRLVMAGMLGYTAPFNGNASLCGVSGVAVKYGLFGYATLFDSEVSSRDVAGATVNYDRHDM
jgi:hypothetical protein